MSTIAIWALVAVALTVLAVALTNKKPKIAEGKHTTMPFKNPGQPKDRLSDFEGSLVALQGREWKEYETKFGNTLALQVQAYIINDNGNGTYINLGEIPIFWKGVAIQVEGAEAFNGSGDYLGGRLRQGTSSNPKAWWVEPPDEEDRGRLEAFAKNLADF